MSGVKVGTRLEQLETLRNRLDHEISSERARLAREPRTVERPARSDPIRVALTRANTTTADIRAWAIAQGLIAPTQRHGRIGLEIIDLYREQVEA